MKKTSVPRLREKRNDEQKQDKCIGFMERISVVIQHIGISMINIHPQVGKLYLLSGSVELCQTMANCCFFCRNCFLLVQRTLQLISYRVWINKNSPFKSHHCKLITSCDLLHILLFCLLIVITKAIPLAMWIRMMSRNKEVKESCKGLLTALLNLHSTLLYQSGGRKMSHWFHLNI